MERNPTHVSSHRNAWFFYLRRPKKLALWIVSAGAAVWCLLALSAWLFVKYRRDFPEARYVDILWPGNWPQYQAKQGDHYIAQSLLLLQQGDHRLALHKLRVGTLKSPANAHGRILLARVYLAYRRPDLAKNVLIDGLHPLATDTSY